MPCTGSGGAVFYSRSRHSNGVNAALGDASVRFITSNVSPTTWFYMGAISDGQVINLN